MADSSPLGNLADRVAGWIGDAGLAVSAVAGVAGLLYFLGPEILEAIADAFEKSRQADSDTEETEDEYEGQDSDEIDDEDMDAEEEEYFEAW
jgi:hypothetical protein